VVGSALVIPLLNGIDHVALLRDRYERVVAGTIRVEAEKASPGRQRSSFVDLELGPQPELVQQTEAVGRELSAAGLSIRVAVGTEVDLLWAS